MKINLLKFIAFTIFFLLNNIILLGQCANTSNIYSFVYDGRTYEIIKENKTWINAAACAVERGGILAEINDVAEQNAIFSELTNNANINVNSTVAPDGGGGSYVWIGGNDLAVEGIWIWDGNNDNMGTQFWMGDLNGSAVVGLYNNWGDEPDDSGGQDALGLSLNGWPIGVAGQWNDVDHQNTLYYVIEYETILGIEEVELYDKIELYPNPVVDYLTINTFEENLIGLKVYNSLGQEIKNFELENNKTSQKIDFTNLDKGFYIIMLNFHNGKSMSRKIVK